MYMPHGHCQAMRVNKAKQVSLNVSHSDVRAAEAWTNSHLYDYSNCTRRHRLRFVLCTVTAALISMDIKRYISLSSRTSHRKTAKTYRGLGYMGRGQTTLCQCAESYYGTLTL